MPIVTAPLIDTLATLTHAFRHVATMGEPGEWFWHGDLATQPAWAIYRIMRDEHRTLVQMARRPTPTTQVLFAAISKRVDPTTAYSAAARFLDGAAERRSIALIIRENARKRRLG